MYVEVGLPFPRGSTWSDDSSVTPTDTAPQGFEGRVFMVKDTEHSGTRPVYLRVVKNDSSSRLSGVDRQCLSFSTNSNTDWGCRVDGLATTGGEPCKPVDDYYKSHGVTGFIAYDLFYVVEQGLCDIMTTSAAAMSTSAGESVQMSGNGKIGYADAGDYVIGIAMDDLATSASTACTVYVESGLRNEI